MKGIVFNLFEQVVTEELGEDAWDDLLEAAGLEGAYTSLGSYPDSELGRLAAAAASSGSSPPDEVVLWFGRRAVPILAERFPEFFAPHRATLPFLLTLNDVIHPEVRKLFPGADVPTFEFEKGADGTLT